MPNMLKRCATMEIHKKLVDTVPYYRKNRYDIENFCQSYRRIRYNSPRLSLIRIPIVIHVVYNTNDQNISESQIQSQITVLNKDYRKLNTDLIYSPSVFWSYAADTLIEFHLSQRDPEDKPTTGITRTFSNKPFFTNDDGVKSERSGGADHWPSDKYLNIWICNLTGGYLGYTQFPGGPSDTDGVVIKYTAFGLDGTTVAPFNLGRTATHEIGHWLNLLHIWGDDDDPSCNSSDNVDDTPNQSSPNNGYPEFPHISCNNGPNGDMFVNYMDYTDDNCMCMFTKGQSDRMNATLEGPRASILNSSALIESSTLSARLSNIIERGEIATKVFDGVTWINPV